eukprot:TRINITY_DN3296_c0_g1_i1.p1 TRINITY_DN3296_c0_g1~~TRINITY_DN3296_c0_g1_i1.p1  ORF type:complete len:364 (+),score=75.26 TRINITY_DN3296_c0_g1_i1:138-1229(+)
MIRMMWHGFWNAGIFLTAVVCFSGATQAEILDEEIVELDELDDVAETGIEDSGDSDEFETVDLELTDEDFEEAQNTPKTPEKSALATFTNRLKKAVDVYWRNPDDGEHIKLTSLPSSGVHTLTVVVGHEISMRDDDGTTVGKFVTTDEESQFYVLTEGGKSAQLANGGKVTGADVKDVQNTPAHTPAIQPTATFTNRLNKDVDIYFRNPDSGEHIKLMPLPSLGVCTLSIVVGHEISMRDDDGAIVGKFVMSDEERQYYALTEDGKSVQLANGGKVSIAIANQLKKDVSVYWKNPDDDQERLMGRIGQDSELRLSSFSHHHLYMRTDDGAMVMDAVVGEDPVQAIVVEGGDDDSEYPSGTDEL